MVSSTSGPHFTPGKDLVPILQEAGWAPGPVWMGRKSRPHQDSTPDRPAHSQSLYRLSYPAHKCTYIVFNNLKFTLKHLKCSTLERFKCFNVNFRLLKTIYVHLLARYLNKLQNARCNDKYSSTLSLTLVLDRGGW